MNEKKKRFSDIMLREKAQIVLKVKEGLLKAICILAEKYPEVTKETANNPNTLVLIDREEEFFSHYHLTSRERLMRAVFRVFKGEIDHDESYSRPFDWFLLALCEDVNNHRWKLNPPDKYIWYWK